MVVSPKLQKIFPFAAVGLVVAVIVGFNLWFFCRIGSIGSICRIGRIGSIGRIIPTPLPTPSPTPTPLPIAQGKQEYNVNTSVKSGPRMSKVTIDPLDARMGESQTIAVAVKSTNTVSGVMVALRTDKNILTNHKLALTTGTTTDGVWSASWRMEVIHDYLYQVIITATDTETSNSTTVTIR